MAEHLNIDVPFNDQDLKTYALNAKDYALTNGIAMRRRNDVRNADVTSHVTLTLLPTPLPRDVFKELQEIQTAYLELYYNVAHDFAFLEKWLKPIAEVDDFIGHLWAVHEEVKNKPKNQHQCLCLARNDFMLDSSSGAKMEPKQIEMNTIAASFGGLGTKLRGYHNYLLKQMGCEDLSARLLESKLDQNFAQAMIDAWKLYNNENAVIVFLIEDINRNIYDQRYLEYAIANLSPTGKPRVLHRTMAQIASTGALREKDRLFIGDVEVGLVYLRVGYNVKQHEGNDAWKVRRMFAHSRAIVCPCIHTHLAGCKKVQQVLCQPGMVEKYVSNDKMAARIRRTFALQYPTDQTPEGDEAVALALKNPEKYVLKSQREGGGNNIYGKDIPPELEKLADSDERGKYILMERVFPPTYPNYIMVPEEDVRFGSTISELGMYVSLVNDGGHVTTNYCGQIYRTKFHGMDEGGVMVGIAAIDSPLLV